LDEIRTKIKRKRRGKKIDAGINEGIISQEHSKHEIKYNVTVVKKNHRTRERESVNERTNKKEI